MKRVLLGLALALASAAGTAGADTFRVVSAPASLPSASTPNTAGALAVPASWTRPPGQPRTLSFQELEAVWQTAGAAYGIPWQVLAAINKVESNFGRNMGPSSANAIGWMQFLPSTWLRWGLDANGDGLADPWSPEDAVFAAARYLAASGGQTDISRAIFSYNHAQWYVDEVLQVAKVFDQGGTHGTFRLDRAQQGLDQARRGVVAASRSLASMQKRIRALARAERRILARADRTPLLSDQLELEKQAGLIGARRAHFEARIEKLRAKLNDARSSLRTAQRRAQRDSLAPAAGALLAAPVVEGDYVFPVGGGPAVVSVSHHHHDYPAADIAAPEGSPVYMLADAVVVSSYSSPGGRCGIGLTVRTGDGLTWTYCHLAYLDPGVRQGAFYEAGVQVGLVGSTGHATGPHLHLQLQPPTSYPQAMPWFESFAGTAFRWQDGGGSTSPAPEGEPDVFREVSHADSGVIRFSR
jgi:murein DD-endopeptidase MepM/ murein hydrolase activator NlpD